MKLFRYGESGKEKPGAVGLSGIQLDVSAFGQDYDEHFFEQGGPDLLKAWLDANLDHCAVVPDEARIGPAIKNPCKIICIGLNYYDHARETNLEVPKEPVIFFKSTTAIGGPNDPVIIPKGSLKTDWEVELAVVIGKRTSYIEESEAPSRVAGYMIHNDYSERAFQLERGGQWVKGKSCDSFAPIGPFLVTPDEIKDVNNLRLWLTVNGKMVQDGNSKNLIYKIPFLISYLSHFMTLLPGDIISTGTPAGVGLGQQPAPWYLKAGDLVELGIDGLGSARQLLVSYDQWAKGNLGINNT